jgi:hypothetical protein
MTKLLTAIALAATVAAPAMALDAKEKKDAGKVGADAKGAAADSAKAKAFRDAANKHAAAAAAHWKRAGELWEARQKEVEAMHNENAAASRERNAANALDKDAARLVQAENLRAGAFRLRIEADGLHKGAFGHLVAEGAANRAVADGEKAVKDLQPVAAKFADAIKDLQKDIDQNKARAAAEKAAAARDTEAANKMLAAAKADEDRANGLEKPVPGTPPVIVVKAPAAPKPIAPAPKK